MEQEIVSAPIERLSRFLWLAVDVAHTGEPLKVSSLDAWPLCMQAARKALEIDPHAAEGHCALGLVESGFEWNWPAAEACFEHAIEHQAGLSLIYPLYAISCLLPQGKHEKALAMIERGRALHPFNPLYLSIAAFVYLGARRYDDVHRLHGLGRNLDPAAPPTEPVDAAAKELEGRYDEAIADYRRLGERAVDVTSLLGHALARTGQVDEACACILRLIESPTATPVELARVYSGLREADEALRWLELAVEQRAAHLLIVPFDPRFDWLRTHSRYARALRPMGLNGG